MWPRVWVSVVDSRVAELGSAGAGSRDVSQALSRLPSSYLGGLGNAWRKPGAHPSREGWAVSRIRMSCPGAHPWAFAVPRDGRGGLCAVEVAADGAAVEPGLARDG